jgi:hypothetical protein
MVVTAESLPSKALGLRSSSLKRPLLLQSRAARIVVDPDGSVRSFDSLQEKRALFGFEQIWFYKIQAGIVVHAQRPDFAIRASPRSAQLTGKVFDGVEVAQSLEFYRGQSMGYLRRLRLRNGGPTQIKLRIIEVLDPSAAHFGGSGRRWGSLGVNAFNRESHVAMDEVSDPPSARVVGASPSPSRVYMTASRGRAQELVAAGELPEVTAGMSGQVLVLSSHDFELVPGEGKEILFASLYNAGKLEEALSDFSHIQSGEKQPPVPRPFVAASDPAVTEASSWAISAIESGSYAEDPLERYETMRALALIDPAGARRVIAESKASIRKDGSLPHSMEPSKPGVLETSLLLKGVATYTALSQDKKLARADYPLVKKLASFLVASSKDFRVETDSVLPQGWRRCMGRGYPTGEIPEVSLAVACALEAASQVARMVSKADDAGRFRERSEMISEQVRKRLVDERGFLALCRDSAGRLRTDETVDMVVAAYRHPFMSSAELAAAHRLLEKDFDTKYGPRCVPTTNQVYFNASYGEGQLGAVWPRAVLSDSLVCYRAGLAGMGSLALLKVARLVADDVVKLGGAPGMFPRWVDVEGGEAHGDEPDAVAASRFIEALLEGELGLPEGAERASFAPAASSGIAWVMATDIWAGDTTCAFLGRGAGKPHLFYSSARVESKVGTRFAKGERIEIPIKGVCGVTFYSPGQIICIGNGTSSQVRFTVAFAPKAAELLKHLSGALEVYDTARCTWAKISSIRVSPTMSFEASVEANDWKAYRVSSP